MPPRGIEIENTGSEPLVGLRYFGPDAHSNMPANGAGKITASHPNRQPQPTNNYLFFQSQGILMNQLPKLHNAMWPGLVGKGDGPDQEPPISLQRMLELTAAANVNGQKFEGIDYFLFLPHTDPNASDAQIRSIADQIASYGFSVGSLVSAGLARHRWRFGHG